MVAMQKLSNGGVLISTQVGKTEVVDVDVAKRMICATAYSHQLTLDEVKAYRGVAELAKHFDIDLDSLVMLHNPDQAEQQQGYACVYSFKEPELLDDMEDVDPFEEDEEEESRNSGIKDFSKERAHARSLFDAEKWQECIDYIDGLYGWGPGELAKEPGANPADYVYNREHAVRCMVAFGFEYKNLV